MNAPEIIYQVLWGRAGSPLSVYRREGTMENARAAADLLLSLWAYPGDVVEIREYEMMLVRTVSHQVKVARGSGPLKAPGG